MEDSKDKCPQCGSVLIFISWSVYDNRGLAKCRECGNIWVIENRDDWESIEEEA